jgi:hypothetical protein
MRSKNASGMNLLIRAAILSTSFLTFAALPSAAQCVQPAIGVWSNHYFSKETSTFTATYEAIPKQADMDGIVGFSFKSTNNFGNIAADTRFNTSGTIDVLNGGKFAAAVSVPYSVGQQYQFRVVISPSTHRYSVYVTPPGGSEITLASNYVFYTQQSTTSKLNNWFAYSDIGTQEVCNMKITAGTTSSSTITAPTITTQPATQTVMAGQTATFSVVASGTSPLAYQWAKNGAAISGATSASYTTPATTSTNNGSLFTVTVSNSAGSITSAAATLTVTSTPGTLTLSSSSLSFGSVNVGSSSTLSTTLTNSGGSSVTVSNVTISGAGFQTSGISIGQIIAAGQAANLAVTFAPAATGTVTGGVTITSNASNSPATVSLSGTGAAVLHSASLSWTASTSSVVGYYVYRGTVSGGPYSKLTASSVTQTSYSDTAVQASQTYYYVVTAVNSSGMESAYSQQVSATIP